MPGGSDPRVYVVEDEPGVRASLMFQLEADGFCAAGFETGEAFLAEVADDAEGCAIIDVHLPGISGITVLEALTRSGSRLAALIVTGRGEVALAVRAMRSGALDFIEKPFPKGAITSAVHHAMRGIDSQSRLRREAAKAWMRIDLLTDREREVFDGLVAGKLGKQVAIDLQISPRTVEVHRARIMAKLGVTTGSELLRAGLLAETHILGATVNASAEENLHKGQP